MSLVLAVVGGVGKKMLRWLSQLPSTFSMPWCATLTVLRLVQSSLEADCCCEQHRAALKATAVESHCYGGGLVHSRCSISAPGINRRGLCRSALLLYGFEISGEFYSLGLLISGLTWT